MGKYSKPRELKSTERILLEFLLSAEFPGREELKEQINRTEAVGECDCGCGTIDLAVKPPFRRASVREPIPIEAHGTGVDVLLFVRNGTLLSLEIVDHRDDCPITYPKPDVLELWIPPGGSRERV
jgi:hypothetical protein